ncbi:metallophosphoesterase [Roseateles chitinivorans]|uniref:metallophosphoesterase n=1 Tax=Roseateles chitinivorans TaxID=2917965 RepID=UPI003D679931
MMYRLRILHVSDLHERVALASMTEERRRLIDLGESRRLRVFDSPNGGLFSKLRELAQQKPFDLVCFTGDIADWGLVEEYEAATQRVLNLLSAAGVDKSRLFLVPGNHDIDRTQSSDAWKRLRRASEQPGYGRHFGDWFAGARVPFGAVEDDKEAVLLRSRNFWSWVRCTLGRDDLLPEKSAHRALGYRATLDLPGRPFPINIVGLDSAWMAGGDDDAKRLWLTHAQLDLLSLERGRPLDGFRLALVHHPLSDLADEGDSFMRLSGAIDLLLHGHQHVELAEQRQSPDGRLQVLAAGSLYENDGGDQWVNAFHVIQVELNQFGHPLGYDIEFFAWSAKAHHWYQDNGVYRVADTGRLRIDVPPRQNAGFRTVPLQDKPAELDRTCAEQVATLGLWRHLLATSPSLAMAVQTTLNPIGRALLGAKHALPSDRWRDHDAPLFVLRAFESLVGDQVHQLSAAECAVALLVPFVYEVVLAQGWLLLQDQGDPLDPLKDIERVDAPYAWSSLRNYARSEDRLIRQREQLLRRENIVAAEDLSAWHVYQFLHMSGELWDCGSGADGIGGWLANKLSEVLGDPPVLLGDDADLLHPLRLVHFARLMFGTVEDIEAAASVNIPFHLRLDTRDLALPSHYRVREVSLAHLLALAAMMALDARRMEGPAVEQVGAGREISATVLREMLQKARWDRADDESLTLALKCRHEAIDLTVRQVVAALDVRRHEILERSGFHEPYRSMLPRQFDDSKVLAEIDQHGHPRYRRPHLQMSLDQARVMDLLMGHALYQNPEVALRELYQNALDACRLRQARNDYQRRSRTTKLLPPLYEGAILFRAGFHDRRPYIECTDNGIGMAERHVRAYFARAGRRFTDSHEFHVEKAAWARQGVFCHLNSRFGIGVFGYFMVAEEVVIESKRVRPNGEDLEPAVFAAIYSGSSLFRMQQPRADIPAGTTVRLYLRDTTAEALNGLLQRMLDWLWLPEFTTELIDANDTRTKLEAGRPSPGFLAVIPHPVEVANSQDGKGHPRLFWHLQNERADGSSNPGSILLADGIRTENGSDVQTECLVINLNGELRPELKVDRSAVTAWPKGFAYLSRSVDEGAWRNLLDFPDVGLLRLEEAFERWMSPLLQLDRAWRTGALPVAGLSTPGVVPMPEDDRREREEDDEDAFWSPDVSPDILKGTAVALLRRYPLGVAPMLDRLILRGTQFRRRDRREQALLPPVNRLLIAELAPGLARCLGGRATALSDAGVKLGRGYRQLAEFARLQEWPDRPSLGLSLLVADGKPDGELPRLDGNFLVEQSLHQQVPLVDLIEVCRPLEFLGLKLPSWLDRLLVLSTLPEPAVLLLRALSEPPLDLWQPCSLARLLSAMRKAGLSPSPSATKSAMAVLSTIGIEFTSLAVAAAWTIGEEKALRLDDLWVSLQSEMARRKPEVAVPWVAWFTPIRAYVSSGGSIEEVADSVTSFVPGALHHPELSRVVEEWLNSDMLPKMLSRDGDGISPWKDTLDFESLVLFARRVGVDIAFATKQMQHLGLIVETPQAEVVGIDSLSDDVILLVRDILLSVPPTADESLRSLPFGRLLDAARELMTRGGSLDELEKVCELLRMRGLDCPEAGRVTAKMLDSDVLVKALSRDFDGKGPWLDAVDAKGVLLAADYAAESVPDVVRTLDDFGLLESGLNGLDFDSATIESIRLLGELMRASKLGDGVSERRILPLGRLLQMLGHGKIQFENFQDVADACQMLQALGIECPGALNLVPDWIGDDAMLAMLSRDGDGLTPWVTRMKVDNLLRLANRDQCSLRDTIDHLSALSELLPDVSGLNPEFLALVPTDEHIALLDARREGYLSLGALLHVADQTQQILGAVVESALDLQRLNCASVYPVSDRQLRTALTQRHLYLLSQDADGRSPWLEVIDLRHVQRVAEVWDDTLVSMLEDVLPLMKFGIKTPEWTLPDPKASEQLERLLRWLGPRQDALYSWELAEYIDDEKPDATALLQAVEALERLGIRVDDAKAFARHCADFQEFDPVED